MSKDVIDFEERLSAKIAEQTKFISESEALNGNYTLNKLKGTVVERIYSTLCALEADENAIPIDVSDIMISDKSGDVIIVMRLPNGCEISHATGKTDLARAINLADYVYMEADETGQFINVALTIDGVYVPIN